MRPRPAPAARARRPLRARLSAPPSAECIEWTGGQIKNDDSAEDVKNVDLTCVHNLSGPIAFSDEAGEPAHPGDLLVVEARPPRAGCSPVARHGVPQAVWLRRAARRRTARPAARPRAPQICNLGPLVGSEWGYTGIFDRDNGGGFLTDHFPGAAKVRPPSALPAQSALPRW